jgi:molybdopterin molybdotransferase
MISVTQAQELIDRHSGALADEAVPLAEAHGRILREPVVSAEDLPGFDRSAMDGYAMRVDDGSDELEVVGEFRAGQTEDRELKPGQAIRILTGARLPGDGLKVVMQEHVELREGRIHIKERSSASHIRKRGEDARAGEVLLEPGVTLNAAAMAVLASMGKTSVQVSRQPRILHLTTGDEIVSPEQTPQSGQIRNSNASLIAGLCREAGVDEIEHHHSGDDAKTMLDYIAMARAGAYDLVLVSGGSGNGTYDFTARVFEEEGGVFHFRNINVRPGKPMIFATAGSQIMMGLPGNALSHFVCFQLFVRRALDRLLARASAVPVQAFLSEPMLETKNARETWWPAQASFKDGRLECRALAWKSSGDITRLPAANTLIQVPSSTSQFPAGTMVNLLLTQIAL